MRSETAHGIPKQGEGTAGDEEQTGATSDREIIIEWERTAMHAIYWARDGSSV
jgi:hypothetical protein